ncbi:hypothetical protein L204_105813 [Cryptococcus depauperatus]
MTNTNIPHSFAPDYKVGRRYLHAKSGSPLTLRYIGPLPPTSSCSPPTQQIWLGIEYDNPSLGKHSGTYQGIRVFETAEQGSAAFLKLVGNPLIEGNSLVDSLEERYGIIDPAQKQPKKPQNDLDQDEIVLGSSKGAVKIEANWQNALERVSNLEKLRNIGFDDEYIVQLGGDKNKRDLMKKRLKGVKWLNLAKNLLNTWEEVADIVECFEGLEILTLSHSRISCISETIECQSQQRFVETFRQIRELHLSDCLMTMSAMAILVPLFPALEVLYLEANRTLNILNIVSKTRPLQGNTTIKELRIGGCPVEDWKEVSSLFQFFLGLHTLDISYTLVSIVPADQTRIENIAHLALLNSCLSSWADLGHISQQFPNLVSLKFTLKGQDRQEEDFDAKQECPSLAISPSATLQRALAIAMFPLLASFNFTSVIPSERRDAEIFYISFVDRYLCKYSEEKGEQWCRYLDLCKTYGKEESKAEKKSEGLRGRMITLNIITHHTSEPTTLSFLPSTPIPLLQRKIARQLSLPLNAPINIWTVRETKGRRENIASVTAEETMVKRDVGWWFRDGDMAYVDSI